MKVSDDKEKFAERFEQIGLKITYYRRRRLYSCDDLAKRAGISAGKVRRMERGWCGYNVSDLLSVAQALAVDAGMLVKK